MHGVRRVVVYPAFHARYYAHFVDALQAIFGTWRVRFSVRGFPSFGRDCLAFRIVGETDRKVYIHTDDAPTIDAEGLAWCDAFGKVNLDWSLVPEGATDKVVPIGPTFPFRTFGAVRTMARALHTYLSGGGGLVPMRQHFGTYRGLYASRFSEREYRPSSSRSDYVFFNGSLWEREPEANRSRANFVEAGRSVSTITFEGGLTPRDSARGVAGWNAPGYECYLVPRYPGREHLEKTRRSAVAFNNPAYRDCHSWRLAEYMALGKAIISTPLMRAVPAPLLHGEHLHIVEGSPDSIREAIGRICGDADYRIHLETGARHYYVKYLHPRRVMLRLLARAGLEPEQEPAGVAR